MPGLLFDSWGAKDPNTASCCLNNKADTSHRQGPKIELMFSDAQQNPRETTLLSLSPCSHGLDLRLTAPNHGEASAAGTGLGRSGRLCPPAPHPLQGGGGALSLANVKTIIKPTQSLLLVITVCWQS